MKYLIIRLGAIGDVVHSTIIAQAIKSKYPDSEVHFLTASFIKPLVELSPFVDKVISFDMNKNNNLFYIIKTALSLFKERYDIIFPLSNTLRNMLMSYLAFPKRIVKRNKNRVHAADAFFNTAVDGVGEVEKPKQIILAIKDETKNIVEEKIKDCPRPYIVFSPGGANDNARQGRVWSDASWIELGNKLYEKCGGTIFVCGSKSEQDRHSKFVKINNAKIFTGTMSLEESAVLYSMADLFISGDSGPLHIAACFDTSIVALYGSTDPISVAPYGHINNCITPVSECKFCGQKVCAKLEAGESVTPCMKSITPDMVMSFIDVNNKLEKHRETVLQ